MIKVKAEDQHFSQSEFPFTRLFIILDPTDWVVKTVVLKEKVNHWPAFTVYRSRPLGVTQQVIDFLNTSRGQRLLKAVKDEAGWEDWSNRWIQHSEVALSRLQKACRFAALDGVDPQPYLNGEKAIPNGFTRLQVLHDLSAHLVCGLC